MALVKCSECGSDVSNRATKCQKCGAPVPQGTRQLLYLLLFIVLAIIGCVAVKWYYQYQRDANQNGARNAMQWHP